MVWIYFGPHSRRCLPLLVPVAALFNKHETILGPALFSDVSVDLSLLATGGAEYVELKNTVQQRRQLYS